MRLATDGSPFSSAWTQATSPSRIYRSASFWDGCAARHAVLASAAIEMINDMNAIRTAALPLFWRQADNGRVRIFILPDDCRCEPLPWLALAAPDRMKVRTHGIIAVRPAWRRKSSDSCLQLDDVSLDVGDIAPRNLVSGANRGGNDLANCRTAGGEDLISRCRHRGHR